MADLQNRAVVDIEGSIARLRGVISARVVTGDRGDIEEIHVLADQTRHPKQLGRDIESALFSELGVRIDHRVISIAQVREPQQEVSAVRLKFLGIDYSLDRSAARVRVSVGHGDTAFTGAASATTSGDVSPEHLVARAAVAAVEEFVRSGNLSTGTATLELQNFTRSATNGSTYMTAQVRLVGERGEEELVGSVLVRDDPWRAAAFAVLDALNRRLSSLCS